MLLMGRKGDSDKGSNAGNLHIYYELFSTSE